MPSTGTDGGDNSCCVKSISCRLLVSFPKLLSRDSDLISPVNLAITDDSLFTLKYIEIPARMVITTIVFALFARRFFLPTREKKNRLDIISPRNEARVLV